MAKRSPAQKKSSKKPSSPRPKKNSGKRSGHIPKLTPFTHTLICNAIATGNFTTTACQLAGIEYSTFTRWRELGIKGHPVFRKFALDVDKAEAKSEEHAIELIKESATGLVTIERYTNEKGEETERKTYTKDWRAAAWLLERRHGTRWAMMRKMQHSGALNTRQEVIVRNDEDFDADLEEGGESDAKGPEDPADE